MGEEKEKLYLNKGIWASVRKQNENNESRTVKVKVAPKTGHGRPRRVKVWFYEYSFFNLGGGRGGWLTPRPCNFTPGKGTWYEFYRRLSGPQDRLERVRKISPPQGFDPRIVQPIVNRYADWGIPAHYEANSREICSHHNYPRSELPQKSYKI